MEQNVEAIIKSVTRNCPQHDQAVVTTEQTKVPLVLVTPVDFVPLDYISSGIPIAHIGK